VSNRLYVSPLLCCPVLNFTSTSTKIVSCVCPYLNKDYLRMVSKLRRCYSLICHLRQIFQCLPSLMSGQRSTSILHFLMFCKMNQAKISNEYNNGQLLIALIGLASSNPLPSSLRCSFVNLDRYSPGKTSLKIAGKVKYTVSLVWKYLDSFGWSVYLVILYIRLINFITKLLTFLQMQISPGIHKIIWTNIPKDLTISESALTTYTLPQSFRLTPVYFILPHNYPK